MYVPFGCLQQAVGSLAITASLAAKSFQAAINFRMLGDGRRSALYTGYLSQYKQENNARRAALLSAPADATGAGKLSHAFLVLLSFDKISASGKDVASANKLGHRGQLQGECSWRRDLIACAFATCPVHHCNVVRTLMLCADTQLLLRAATSTSRIQCTSLRAHMLRISPQIERSKDQPLRSLRRK